MFLEEAITNSCLVAVGLFAKYLNVSNNHLSKPDVLLALTREMPNNEPNNFISTVYCTMKESRVSLSFSSFGDCLAQWCQNVWL